MASESIVRLVLKLLSHGDAEEVWKYCMMYHICSSDNIYYDYFINVL